MRRRKPFLFQLYDFIAARLEKKRTPEDDVRAHVAEIRLAFRTELSGHLAAALFAKKTLDTTRQVDAPFPDAYFTGEAPIDAAAAPVLLAYAAALVRFQRDLQSRNTSISLVAAKGMTTWIVTLHAMALPGLRPQAQALWEKLMTGAEGVEAAHTFLLRRAPSDVERTYFSYRPTALLPPAA
ncbi:MAG: hypothetical protein K2P94_15360 [Rhodospirillaceae bacterium]|nr:hypothetical protein [Rhodospirillaceae bacterium]